MLSRIKKEFQNKRVAFGKSATRLGLRKDLDELAIIAHESNDESIINLFSHLPDIDTLRKNKIRIQLQQLVAEIKSTK